MINRDDVQSWIAERLGDVEQEGVAYFFGLKHHSGMGEDREIFTMKAGSPKWGDAEAMANLFWTEASRTAKGLIGYQQFQLEVCYGTATKATRALPFGITGALQIGMAHGGMSSGLIATEGPSQIGQTSQAMRLLETLGQGFFRGHENLSKAQQDFIAKLIEENTAYKRENAELWLALREQFAKMIADARAHQMELLKFLRTSEMHRRLMQMAPAILNMMAGQEVFPRSAEDTSLITGLIECVGEDDLRGLLAMLATKPNGEMISGLVTSRIAALKRQKAEEEKENRRLVEEATGRTYEEAERDAGGEAVKALTKIGRQEPALPAHDDKSVDAIVRATQDLRDDGGLTVVEPSAAQEAPKGDKAGDAALWDDLFAKVPDGQINMLADLLGAQDPELARRIRARYEQAKGT